MTPNRKVLDLSHYNTVTSWQQVKDAGIIGIIHKASEGASYVDDHYSAAKSEALAHGLLWGAYHFGNGSNVDAQLDNFLRVAGVDDQTLYALDWEDDPHGNTMGIPLVTWFLANIELRTGRKGVLYSGNTVKTALRSTDSKFFGSHRLWLAQYSSAPVAQASWDSIWLWQYSDGVNGPQPHGCPGVTGDVDTNSWSGTDQELKDQWAGLPTSKIPLVTVNISADQPVRIRLVTGNNVTT